MVTRASDGSAARVGAGIISLWSDLIEDRPMSVRVEISDKACSLYVRIVVMSVYVRRGRAFLYVINVIIINIRSCLRIKALRSLEREPDFRE